VNFIRSNTVQLLALSGLCYFIIFHKMGAHPIRLWDESFFAVHSYEMLQKGSWFVSFFDGVPDFRGSKPPLQNWFQMFFISIFGMSEAAIRLPSALAATGSVFLLFFFLKRETNKLQAWLASLVLLTSFGFITFHSARTGDSDSLLSLALLGQFISVYYMFKSDKPLKWIALFFVALIVSFFTKAFAAGFFLFGFLLYALFFERAKFFGICKKWPVYVYFLSAATLIAGYFVMRENLQSGYIEYAFRVHAGRFSNVIGLHGNPWDFYLRNFLRERYTWWLALAMIGLVATIIWKTNQDRLMRLTSVTALSFLVLISFSKSKLGWYDAPVYPLLAVLSAWSLYQIVTVRELSDMSVLILVAAIFLLPVWDMLRRADSNYPGLAEREFEIKEYYLHKWFASQKDPNGMIVLKDMFPGGLLFYKHAFADRGQLLVLQQGTQDLLGKNVLVSDEGYRREIKTQYTVDTLDKVRSAVLLNIKGYNK
jgi:4-amino-4-deoxy-L-arabinose transferase-like glycosyltransferase